MTTPELGPRESARNRIGTYIRGGETVRHSTYGLMDQALISGFSFATMIVLARALGAEAFGSFTLAYAFMLFANGLQAALITQPHNVLGATRQGVYYTDYTTSTAFSQVLLLIPLVFLTIAAMFMIDLLDLYDVSLVWSLSIAIVARQVHEFCRRVLYTRSRSLPALKLDFVCYGGQTAVIVLLWNTRGLSAPSALYSVAVAAAFAGVWGLLMIRSEISGRLKREHFLENLRFGRWLSAATIVSWFSNQFYLYLVAAFVGVGAVGVLRTIQNLVAPTQVVMTTFQTVFTPRFAFELNRHGQQAMFALFLKSTSMALLPIAVYLLVTGVFSGELMGVLYSDEYAGNESIVWLFCLAYLILFLSVALSTALTALAAPMPIFWAQVMGMVVSCTLGILLLDSFGLLGMMLGVNLSQLAVVVVLGCYLRKVFATNSSSQPSDWRNREYSATDQMPSWVERVP